MRYPLLKLWIPRRSKMKKYIYFIIVFIFAAGLLSACGGGGTSPPSSGGSATGAWDSSRWDDGSTYAP